jgi:putative membrane protein
MKHYDNIDHDKLILRDFLAKDRTALANERTFLAYARTSIMIFASGITLFKLFSDDIFLVLLGYLLIPVSFAVLALGAIRFFTVKKHLSAFTKKT